MTNKLTAIQKICDLTYSADPENDGGYVAEVGSILLARSFTKQLEAAGFEGSWSQDDDGKCFVWMS